MPKSPHVHVAVHQLAQRAVRPWQELSWAHTEQLVTNIIDKVCRYLQSKEIVGNRIFITVLNLLNRAWNTSYFNNERVLKNSAPKNLFRMVKNNIPASQINGTPILLLGKLHLTKPSFWAQKGYLCGPHELCPCQWVICPPLIPVTQMPIQKYIAWFNIIARKY